ncbi:hypothetical protein [Maridesulfovibrio sp.]|uniref:hypothetical protein n=1 Tax=Maridesulfovibrio sp. TaxID=2795000 RepID=UPI0039EF9665
MTKKATIILLICAAIISVISGTAMAAGEDSRSFNAPREVSGRKIKGLVEKLDSGFTSLEESISQYAEQKADAQANFNLLRDSLKNEKDPNKKAEYKAAILKEVNNINKYAQKEVDAYIKALGSFIPTLKVLSNEIRTHQFGPDSAEAKALAGQRDRIMQGYKNNAHVLVGLQNLKGVDPKQLAAIKLSMGVGFNTAQAYSNGSRVMNAEAVDNMRKSYALLIGQLYSVKKLLKLERTGIKLATFQTVMNMLKDRANTLRIKGETFAGIPGAIQGEIGGRSEVLEDIIYEKNNMDSDNFGNSMENEAFQAILDS